MKYFCVLHNIDLISILSTEKIEMFNFLPNTYFEIAKEQFDYLNEGLKNNQLIFCDKNKNLKLRDRFTKWDETTEQWIHDEDAIANNKMQLLKTQAQQALNETVIYSDPAYRIRLTKEENKVNDTYRAQLYDILENKYNGTELPINPNLLKG